MGEKKLKRVIFTCGGTAGHVNPAIALAQFMHQQDADTEFLFVGAEGRMETVLVPQAGYPIRTLKVEGFQRRLSLKNIKKKLIG